MAEFPLGLYGTYEDNAAGAVNQSSWALGAPLRTMNNPLEAIRAVIAVDWLADELVVDPRWIVISPLTKQHMRQARMDVRRVLGISIDAPSASVMDALLSTAWGLEQGARPDDIGAFKNSPFALPPQQTFNRLSNLPYIATANIATSEAATQIPTNGRRS
ncbi:MAG TPA: hypothetical protein VL614_13600 [Acetobacteraceae bacterium]|nr:hypothetical protein [Acetobacteraceae bacterium]